MTDTIRIIFVCLGNICRSPMAESVLRRLVDDAGLAERVEVTSAGTGDWHIGERADKRTIEALAKRGYEATAHRARQFRADWFRAYDFVIALDASNFAALRRLAPPGCEGRLRLLMSFVDDTAVTDVPDPYYGDAADFDQSLDLVEQSCRALLEELRARLGE